MNDSYVRFSDPRESMTLAKQYLLLRVYYSLSRIGVHNTLLFILVRSFFVLLGGRLPKESEPRLKKEKDTFSKNFLETLLLLLSTYDTFYPRTHTHLSRVNGEATFYIFFITNWGCDLHPIIITVEPNLWVNRAHR
jgi:hypothetical protein